MKEENTCWQTWLLDRWKIFFISPDKAQPTSSWNRIREIIILVYNFTSFWIQIPQFYIPEYPFHKCCLQAPSFLRPMAHQSPSWYTCPLHIQQDSCHSKSQVQIIFWNIIVKVYNQFVFCYNTYIDCLQDQVKGVLIARHNLLCKVWHTQDLPWAR